MTQPTRIRMVGFGVLLAWVMAAGALAYTAMSVLSVFIIRDLGISRSGFGLIVAVMSLVGMLSAPIVGLLADRQGGVVALRMLLGVTTAGLLAMAIAPHYLLMVGAVAVAGVGSTSGNPITNNLIASYLPDGRRGFMVGVKHGGGQLGVLAASLILPAIAVAVGWRLGIALLAVVPLAALAGSRLAQPGERIPDQATETPRRRQRTSLIANAALMGVGSSAIISFAPLYSQEVLGMSTSGAGFVIAVIAGFAVVSRLYWGWRGDTFRVPTTPLVLIAAISVIAALGFVIAPQLGTGAVWFGAAAAGIGTMAWHSAGMLVVLHGAGSGDSGKATAAVHVGFLGGWTVGPVIFGVIVDQFSYLPAWITLVGVFLIAGMVVTNQQARVEQEGDKHGNRFSSRH